ncbi:MAG TPA: M15 family metallopeptidase [Candidatus Paceibacterota bacterium]
MTDTNHYKSLEEVLTSIKVPKQIRDSLAFIDLLYISFDGTEQTGQLVVHKDLVADIKAIFKKLHERKFPIHKMVPIVAYGWDDEASMQDNNTSAFNYRRTIATNILSNHSFGRAIDINPRQNPFFAQDGNVYPLGAVYDPAIPGTVTKDSNVVRIFKEYGWEWLGEREQNPDYQHFQKLI